MSEVAVGYISLVPKFGSGFKSAIAGEIGQAGTAGGQVAGNSFKSTFLGVLAGNLMTSAIRGIGNTIKGAFGGGFDRLMNIEQAEIKLKTLGLNVEAVMGNVGDAVDGTRFAISDAADMAATLGASGVKAGEGMTRWLSLTADTAQFMGTSFGEAQSIIGTIAAQGRVTGAELNRLPLAAAALADHLGISQEEVRKLASQGKISADDFADAMENTIGGAAKNAGESFLSVVANLRTALNASAANLMKPFVEGLKPVLTAGLDLVKGFRDGVSKPLGEALGEFIQPRAEALAASMATWPEKIGGFVSSVRSGLGFVGGAFRSLQALVVPIVEGLAGGIRAFAAAWRAADGDVTSSGFAGFMERLANTLRAVFTEALGGITAFAASWRAFDGEVTSSGLPGFMERLAFVARTVLTEITGGLRAFVGAWRAFDGDVTSSGFPGFMERLAFVTRSVLGEIVGGVRAFAAAWQAADGDVTSSGFPGFMERLANTIRTVFTGAKDAVLGFVDGFGGIDSIVETFSGILPLITGPLGLLKTALMEVFGSGGMSIDFGELGRTVGSSLKPILEVAAELASVLTGVLATALSQLLPVALDLGMTFMSLAGDLAAQLLPILSSLASQLLPMVASLIAQLAPVILDVVSALAPLIAGLVETLAPAILNLIEAVLPPLMSILGIVSQAFADLAAALMPLVTTLVELLAPIIAQIVGEILPPLLGVLLEVVNLVLAMVVPAITAFVQVLSAVLTPVIQTLSPLIQTVFGFISRTIGNVMGVIQGIIRTVTGIITGDWSKAWSGIKLIFSSIWDQIKNIASTAANLVLGIFRAGFDLISSTVSGILNRLVSFVTGIPGRFMSGLNALSQLGARAREWVGGFVQGATDRFNAAVDFVRNIPSRILSALGNVRSFLTDAGMSLINGFTNGITSAFSRATDAVKNGVQKIRNFFPFSPAKEGPFSGSGYTTHSGRKLMQDFAAGIAAESSAANRALEDALTVTPTLDGIATGGTAGVSQSGGLLGGTTIAGPLVHVAQMIVRNDDDIRRLSQELQRLIEAKLRSLGKSTVGGIA